MGTILYPDTASDTWMSEVGELAQRFGMNVRAMDLADGAMPAVIGANHIVLVPVLPLDDLGALIQRGCKALVETASPLGLLGIWNDLTARLADSDRLLTMVLTTGTAYRAQMAMHVVAGLRQCTEIGDEKAGDIELSLHEVLANNIIHGNLELSSKLREEAESFSDYITLLEERLGDAELAARPVLADAVRIDGGIRIFARDCGQGFNPKTVEPIKWKQASGRGIDIARALSQNIEYSMGGRQVSLDYLYAISSGDDA